MRKVKRLVQVLALSAIILATCMSTGANALPLKRGSYGSEVRTLQNKLAAWDYYNYTVDGIYGSRTESAVKQFQKNNGLTVDGIVGERTARAIGMSTGSSQGSSSGASSSSSTSKNVYQLAQLIHAEARGEPYKGQVAVGAVVLNRVESSLFPNSIAGVIYQSGAFSVVSDGQINLAPNESALKAARDALNGWDPTNGCIYYYNPATATSSWIFSRPVLLRIGKHVFCK